MLRITIPSLLVTDSELTTCLASRLIQLDAFVLHRPLGNGKPAAGASGIRAPPPARAAPPTKVATAPPATRPLSSGKELSEEACL